MLYEVEVASSQPMMVRIDVAAKLRLVQDGWPSWFPVRHPRHHGMADVACPVNKFKSILEISPNS